MSKVPPHSRSDSDNSKRPQQDPLSVPANVEAELRREVSQIEDLILLVRAGRNDHVIGLSTIVRKLILTGDPLPYLQLAAAWAAAGLVDTLLS